MPEARAAPPPNDDPLSCSLSLRDAADSLPPKPHQLRRRRASATPPSHQCHHSRDRSAGPASFGSTTTDPRPQQRTPPSQPATTTSPPRLRSGSAMATTSTAAGLPRSTVLINVYDIAGANALLHPLGLGIHHSGIEVYGAEYAFGRTPSSAPAATGVWELEPRVCPPHVFREALVLGSTHLSPAEVAAVVRNLSREWLGSTYELTRNNCNHFSAFFARLLLSGTAVPRAPMPRPGALPGPGDEHDEDVEGLHPERTYRHVGNALTALFNAIAAAVGALRSLCQGSKPPAVAGSPTVAGATEHVVFSGGGSAAAGPGSAAAAPRVFPSRRVDGEHYGEPVPAYVNRLSAWGVRVLGPLVDRIDRLDARMQEGA